MKRYLCFFLAVLTLLSLAACGKKGNDSGAADTGGDATEAGPTVGSGSEAPTTEPPDTEPAGPYLDVSVGDACYDAAMWAKENGLVAGNTFDPDGLCTRGEVITLLWRAMGSPEPAAADNPFTDSDPSGWFYKQALWAYENGIILSGTVSAGSECPMGQVLTILWRANGSPITAANASAIADKYTGQYYEKALAWADLCGLLNAVGQAVEPDAPCTRATVVMYLHWLKDNFSFTPEDAAVQAEYAKLVADAPLYGLTGEGLVYAQYIDAEGDGKVELLTVGLEDGEDYYKNLTLSIYANVDGHAGKVAELTDEINIIENHVTFTLSFDPAAEGPRLNYYATGHSFHRDSEDFGQYRFEGKAVTKAEIGQSYAEYYDVEGEEEQTISGVSVTAEEFRAAADKNNTGTPILTFQSSFGEASAAVENGGLLPDSSRFRGMIVSKIKAGDAKVKAHVLDLIRSGDEDMIALVTDMILGGDFSAVSGTYTPVRSYSSLYYGPVTLLPDGTVYGEGYDAVYEIAGHKPGRIELDWDGSIRVSVADCKTSQWYYIYFRQSDIAEYFDSTYTGPVIWYNTYDGGVWDEPFAMAD